jgi:MscS family membrane protein
MEKAVEMIRDLIANDEDVAMDATHLVRFNDFTESGLSIMLYYFTKSTGWDAHLASRERINLSIMRILEELGMKLAVPARTVTLTAEDANRAADMPPQATKSPVPPKDSVGPA